MFNETEFTTTQEQPTSGSLEIKNITRPHSLTLLTILTKVFLPLHSVVLLFLLVTYLALVLREIWSRKRTLSDSSAGAMEEHGDVVNYKVHSKVIQSQLTQTKAAEKTSGCEKSVKTCHSQDDSYVNVQTMQGVNYDKISATLDQSEPYNNLVLYGQVLKTTRNVHSESTFLYVNTAKSSEYLNSQIVFDENVNETIMYTNISEVSNRNLQHK
ncbi:hypothetical protein Bpfe_028734 [Biomphalaria pfeifferi]|uniref:Uncharacterized protein n=1 Tax=Biomphalaria pfeifferi TaxID=112525 RepID=A0AAD8ASW7_BIOPF|nr:hypothetical protein Bpfe_028734 [Biomphalaria pfeifferi]